MADERPRVTVAQDALKCCSFPARAEAPLTQESGGKGDVDLRACPVTGCDVVECWQSLRSWVGRRKSVRNTDNMCLAGGQNKIVPDGMQPTTFRDGVWLVPPHVFAQKMDVF